MRKPAEEVDPVELSLIQIQIIASVCRRNMEVPDAPRGPYDALGMIYDLARDAQLDWLRDKPKGCGK